MLLILNGVDRFFRPHELNAPELGIYVSAIAILVTFGLVLFQRYVVRKAKQPSDCRRLAPLSIRSADERGHHGCAGIKLVGIGSSGCHFAIGIGLYILFSAFKMVHDAVQTLLDRKLPDEELEQIHAICLSVAGVIGMHQLRTRMSGPVRFIQLHLELDDNISLLEAHQISDRVEDKLREHFVGLMF